MLFPLFLRLAHPDWVWVEGNIDQTGPGIEGVVRYRAQSPHVLIPVILSLVGWRTRCT